MKSKLNLRSSYVEITNKCNLHCKHCYNDSKYQNNIFIDIDVIEKLYKSFFINHIDRLFISGGEPLLHPDILQILKFAKDYQIKTQIITNGVLLDKYCDCINGNTNIMVQVSIDGIGETHDMIRGNGVFKVVDSNINKLDSQVNLSIKSTINSYNMDQIEAIIKYAIQKGASTVAFSPLSNQGRCTENKDIHLSAFKLRKTIDIVANMAEKYKDYIDVRKININYSQCPLVLSGKVDVSPRIDSFGNVYLCSMFTNQLFIVGNVNQDDLVSILQSERCNSVIRFLKSFLNILDCNQCLVNNLCQKGCLAQYLNNLPNYQDDMCAVKKASFIRYIEKNNINGV